MAEKKSKVKAHRGFIHIPKRRGPRRPIRRNPVNLKNLGYFGRLPKGMQDLLLGGRRRPPRGPIRPIQQPVRPPSLRRYNDELRVLRDFAKARGKTIPRFPTGNPPPSIRKDPRKMKQFRLRQLQNQIYQTRRFLNLGPRKTQQQLIPIKQINDARKFLQQDVMKKLRQTATAAMGSKRKTAAPAQRAVRNPNRRRRPMTADQRLKMIRSQNARVAKGGTVKKKK